MNNILHKQKEFLKILAHKKKDRLKHDPSSKVFITKGQIVAYIKEQSFFMGEEINELILAIGDNDRAILKPWQINHFKLANERFQPSDAVKEEAIDMLCFCMNICLAAGLTPENIAEEYEKKWLENISRQERGY